MPSPTCTVNTAATTDGVNVAASTTITIQLADTTGVSSWSITCIGTDENQTSAAVTAALVVDSGTRTAVKTGGYAAGTTLIFRSVINGGRDVNGAVVAAYTTTFGVFVLTANGDRVVAVGQTLENSAAFGWVASINAMIRSLGTGAPTTATYLCLTTNATLANERVATAGQAISLTDAGAGGACTIAFTGVCGAVNIATTGTLGCGALTATSGNFGSGTVQTTGSILAGSVTVANGNKVVSNFLAVFSTSGTSESTVDFATTTDRDYVVTIQCIAKKSDEAARAEQILSARFKNVAGTVTRWGNSGNLATSTLETDGTTTGIAFDARVSTTNIRFGFTPPSAGGNWECTMSIELTVVD